MDVGDAGVDRVDQDLLDVLDDRRVLDLRFSSSVSAVTLPSWRSSSRSSIVGDLAERRTGRLDQLGDRLRELVVLDHDRLDDEIRLESHLLERLEVGRIGGRDVEPVAALVQRQDAPRLRPS